MIPVVVRPGGKWPSSSHICRVLSLPRPSPPVAIFRIVLSPNVHNLAWTQGTNNKTAVLSSRLSCYVPSMFRHDGNRAGSPRRKESIETDQTHDVPITEREREREIKDRPPSFLHGRRPTADCSFACTKPSKKRITYVCAAIRFSVPPPLPQTLRGSQVALGSLKSSSFRRPARRLACQAGKRGEGGERSHMTRGPPLTRSTGGMGPRAQRGGRRLAALNTCPRLRKVRKMLNVINVFPSRRGGGGPQYPPAIFYAHDRRKASEGSGVKTHSLTHSPCDIHGHVGR